MMIFVAILFYILALNGILSKVESIFLLLLYIAYIMFLLKSKPIKKKARFREFVDYFMKMEYLVTIKNTALKQLTKKRSLKSLALQIRKMYYSAFRHGLIKDFLIIIISIFAITYSPQKKSYYATNTDIPGAILPLLNVTRKEGFIDTIEGFLVLGAGGGAKAAVAGALMHGIHPYEIFVLNKFKGRKYNEERILDLARRFDCNCIEDVTELNGMMDIAYLINATNIGKVQHENEMPISPEELKSLLEFNGLQVVEDMNYNPAESLLIKEAKKLGIKTINGAPMAAITQLELYRFAFATRDINLDDIIPKDKQKYMLNVMVNSISP